MKLDRLHDVLSREGPLATVYLESRSPGENSPELMRLRWKALRDRLSDAGAPPGVLQALDGALDQDQPGEEQADGRVLVAAEDGVLLEEAWDAAQGAGDDAHWTRLPELGAYVRERARAVRALVVLADQEHGAEIRQEVVAEEHTPREVAAEEVDASATEGVHKPYGGGDFANKQIHRRADETLKQNAKEIADRVGTLASRFQPHLVLLGGEIQARTAIRDALRDGVAALCVDLEHGRSSEEELGAEVAARAGEVSSRHSAERGERLQEARAHEHAADGKEQVAAAAEMGAVQVLLLEHGVPAEREAFLLQTCAETDAEVDVLPAGAGLTDGVAAILRFPLPE